MREPQTLPVFGAGKFLRDVLGNAFKPGRPLGMVRDLNAEILRGRHEGRASKGSPSSLSQQLAKVAGRSRQLARRTSRRGFSQSDRSQRAIVKIHYFAHGGGGAAALRAHARYIGRDGAAPDEAEDGPLSPIEDGNTQPARLSRERADVFYSRDEDGVDGAAIATEWARKDRRHFRIILSAENGARLGDLRAYTREVMERTANALGEPLDWIAVDHHDTDNSHTHLILRGRRRDGSDLVIPREFVKHGFRAAARAVATERLGERTREEDRLALQREARAHRLTRLDRIIAAQIPPSGRLRIASLKARSPDISDALKNRAHELKRLGLAIEVSRNVLTFAPEWRKALEAMELHLDIRRALVRARAADKERALSSGVSRMLRGGGRDR